MWVDALEKTLSKQFEIIRPRMPRSENAHYDEWAIHFERFFSFFRDGAVLVGYSLGAVFLAKWLANNRFPKKISGVFLIAPPFDNTLSDEELTNGFVIRGNLSNISKQCDNVHLFFSENDDSVPIVHSEKFRKKLPEANFHIYSDKNGHFCVETFPELVRLIRK
jgi:predicted alpha/beta hydrolase family esterase